MLNFFFCLHCSGDMIFITITAAGIHETTQEVLISKSGKK